MRIVSFWQGDGSGIEGSWACGRDVSLTLVRRWPGQHTIHMATTVRDLVRALEDDGWIQVRQRGSHRQFRHPHKSGTVTVAGKPSADVPPGTLNSVLKQAGLRPADRQDHDNGGGEA